MEALDLLDPPVLVREREGEGEREDLNMAR